MDRQDRSKALGLNRASIKTLGGVTIRAMAVNRDVAILQENLQKITRMNVVSECELSFE